MDVSLLSLYVMLINGANSAIALGTSVSTISRISGENFALIFSTSAFDNLFITSSFSNNDGIIVFNLSVITSDIEFIIWSLSSGKVILSAHVLTYIGKNNGLLKVRVLGR